MTGAHGTVLFGASTNYSALVRPLQWLVIALVFIFFLRVVRAVWVEVRPAGPRQTRGDRRRAAREEERARIGSQPTRGKKQLFLEVLEPADQAGRTFDLEDELTVGRSPGCGVPTTYDPFSSTLHAAPLPTRGPAVGRGSQVHQRDVRQLGTDRQALQAGQG